MAEASLKPWWLMGGRDPDPGNIRDIGPIPEVRSPWDLLSGAMGVGAFPAGIIGSLVLSDMTGQRPTISPTRAIGGAFGEPDGRIFRSPPRDPGREVSDRLIGYEPSESDITVERKMEKRK